LRVLKNRVLGRIYGTERRRAGKKERRKEGKTEGHGRENRITEGFVP
jgi:hypothetical protein